MLRYGFTILIVCTILVWGGAVAQSIAQTISFVKKIPIAADNRATCVKQTMDGEYVILGTYETQYFETYGFLAKTNAHGERIWGWGKSYQATTANAFLQLEDSGFVFVGESYDALVVRTNALAETVWTRKPFHGEGNALIRTRDSALVIAGTKWLGNYAVSDLQLSKMNPSGGLLWTRSYDIATQDIGFDVREMPDGGFVLLGRTSSPSSDSASAVMLRTNANGDSLWTRTFRGPRADSRISLEVTNDGGYIFAMDTTVQTSPLKTLINIVRTDSLARVLWSKSYSHNAARQQACAVHRTTGGGYVVAGSIGTPSLGNEKVWLLGITSQGDTMWTRTFTIDSSTVPTSVAGTSDGGFILTGWTTTFLDSIGYPESFLIKTDMDGLVPVKESPAPNPAGFQLFQNYPNPFNPVTTITYQTGKQGFASMTVYDILGRQVAELVGSPIPAGLHQVRFDGSRLASGVYYYRLQANGFVSTNKMILIR